MSARIVKWLSPRFWVLLFIFSGIIFEVLRRLHITVPGNENDEILLRITLIALLAGVIVVAVNLFNTYEIRGPRDVIRDVLTDLVFLTLCVVCFNTGVLREFSKEAILMIIIASSVAFADFVTSLFIGCMKLFDMDRRPGDRHRYGD